MLLFRALINSLQNYLQKIEEFAALLDAINAQLYKVAEIVEQNDQELASQIH